MRRIGLVALIVAPVLVGGAGAVGLQLARLNGTIVVTGSASLTAIGAGVVISAVIAVVSLIRRALHRRRDAGLAEGTRSERDAHRRFVARLDHELKNPVTAIRAALETEPDPTPGLQVAKGQIDRLALLISGLRSLAALENSEIERVPVHMDSVVADETAAFIDHLTVQGMDRQVAIHLPAAPWPLPVVVGDPDLLAVAIRNLLLNAAKYSDPGARIEVRGFEDGRVVVLEVADTGWGIAAAELPHVWEELWRGTQTGRVEGSGLGLSLVRVIAERHGGQVTIRSRQGEGTSVQLRLPVR